jgi:hypothetical protein
MPDGNGREYYRWSEQAMLTVGTDKLIGQITTIAGLGAEGQSYYRMTQQLQVSNGSLTCTTPLNDGPEGNFDGKSYDTNIICSDGTSGRIRIIVEKWQAQGYGNNGYKGLGIGKLNDNRGLTLIFGPTVKIITAEF